MRVLITDDSNFLRRMFGLFLTDKGFECVYAANGQEAVDLYQQSLCSGERLHCALMDIDMPEMNGLQAIQAIRRLEQEAGIDLEREIRFIVITSHDSLDRLAPDFRRLVSGPYLLKPVTGTALLARLLQVLALDALPAAGRA